MLRVIPCLSKFSQLSTRMNISALTYSRVLHFVNEKLQLNYFCRNYKVQISGKMFKTAISLWKKEQGLWIELNRGNYWWYYLYRFKCFTKGHKRPPNCFSSAKQVYISKGNLFYTINFQKLVLLFKSELFRIYTALKEKSCLYL